MKPPALFTILALAAATAATADTNTVATAGDETDAALIAAIERVTGWTAEELANGLAMLDRVYAADMKTEAGRRKWHGQFVSQTVETNLTTTYTYADGTQISVIPRAATAAELRAAAAKANAGLPTPQMTNGIPAALARARLRRIAEKQTTNTVTKTVDANK